MKIEIKAEDIKKEVKEETNSHESENRGSFYTENRDAISVGSELKTKGYFLNHLQKTRFLKNTFFSRFK